MIHIHSRDGHEMLTQEEFKRRHPGIAAALFAPRPYAEEGEVLKQLRQAADKSVRELAKATGIRLGDASAIETGRVKATPEQEKAWRHFTLMPDKTAYQDEDTLGEEYCSKVGCHACEDTLPESNEPNGYGCAGHDKWVADHAHLIADEVGTCTWQLAGGKSATYFPSDVTADGSRRATLRQVLAHIKEHEADNISMHKMIMALREHFKAWDTPTAPTDKDIVDCIIRHADDVHRVQDFMGQRLKHWLELETLAQTYGVDKILTAGTTEKPTSCPSRLNYRLKLKSGCRSRRPTTASRSPSRQLQPGRS